MTYGIDAITGVLSRVGPPVVTGYSSRSSLVDPAGKFAYVSISNSDDSGSVIAYTIDAATGELSEIVGSPFATGTLFAFFTAHPSGKFIYVANFGPPLSVAGYVSAFTIDSATGALSEVAGSPYATGGDPRSITIDPSGRVAYVVNANSNDISGFTVNTTTGALTSIGAAVAAGTAPVSFAITGTVR